MAGVSKGAIGEVLAARYLRRHGYTILTGNYHSRFGEIDIIATNKKYIAFVEVKTRSETSIYTPEEAVTALKQQKILKTAMLFLQRYPSQLQPRFDVISIVTEHDNPMKVKSLRHIPAAFDGDNMHATF